MKPPKINKREFFPVLLLIFIALLFSWRFFLQKLVPIPLDVIVGIYYPWRDYVWNGLVAGVPFQNSLLSDVVSIIYPWRIYGIDLIKQGIAPLWIPSALGGAPLLANFQSGLLYPLNFLFFLFSNINAWSIYIILQPLFASLFMYIYLKSLRIGNYSSFIGGIVFAFSGFMMVWFEYGIIGHAGLWLPLILFSVDQFSENKVFKWFLIGSLVVCFSVLAGCPQITIYSLITVIGYIFYRFIGQKNSNYLLMFGAIIIGLALSALQTLPGAELLHLSLRQTDPTTEAFSSGIIPFKNLIMFLAPDFFGNPVTGNWWGWASYNETSFYIGIFALFFSIFSLIRNNSDKKSSIFFKCLFIISFLFAFNTPLASLPKAFNIPGLSAASGGRLLFLMDFCLAVLSAFGLETFLQKQNKKQFMVLLGSFFVLFLSIWFFVLFGAKTYFLDSPWLSKLEISQRNLILPTTLFSVLIILGLTNYFIKSKKIIYGWTIKLIIVFFVVFDLFRFGWKYNPFTKSNYLYPETKVTQYLEDNEDLYRFFGLIPQSMFIPYHLYSLEGYDPLMIRRYSEFAQRINEGKFESLSSGSRWISINNQNSPLIDLVGMKYLLTINPLSKTDSKWGLVFQDGKTLIYENKNVLPRSFIVHDYKIADNGEILSNLMDPQADKTTVVFLEEKIDAPIEKKIGNETAEIDKATYRNNQVIINTKSLSAGLLFLSDTYYPGWRALIDNQPVKLYRADYSFRGIPLPKGEHQVRLEYKPQSFIWGLRISLFSFFFIILIGIFRFLKNK